MSMWMLHTKKLIFIVLLFFEFLFLILREIFQGEIFHELTL